MREGGSGLQVLPSIRSESGEGDELGGDYASVSSSASSSGVGASGSGDRARSNSDGGVESGDEDLVHRAAVHEEEERARAGGGQLALALSNGSAAVGSAVHRASTGSSRRKHESPLAAVMGILNGSPSQPQRGSRRRDRRAMGSPGSPQSPWMGQIADGGASGGSGALGTHSDKGAVLGPEGLDGSSVGWHQEGKEAEAGKGGQLEQRAMQSDAASEGQLLFRDTGPSQDARGKPAASRGRPKSLALSMLNRRFGTDAAGVSEDAGPIAVRRAGEMPSATHATGKADEPTG